MIPLSLMWTWNRLIQRTGRLAGAKFLIPKCGSALSPLWGSSSITEDSLPKCVWGVGSVRSLEEEAASDKQLEGELAAYPNNAERLLTSPGPGQAAYTLAATGEDEHLL